MTRLEEAQTAHKNLVEVRSREERTRQALANVPTARSKAKGYPAVLLSARLKLSGATERFNKIAKQLNIKEQDEFLQSIGPGRRVW